MVTITLRLDEFGVLQECRSLGHAEAGPSGRDVLCAAVSVLLRSCARTLEGREGVAIEGSAARPGEMEFRVEGYPEDHRPWLTGVADFLITGLSDLAQEHPEACGLEIIKEF